MTRNILKSSVVQTTMSDYFKEIPPVEIIEVSDFDDNYNEVSDFDDDYNDTDDDNEALKKNCDEYAKKFAEKLTRRSRHSHVLPPSILYEYYDSLTRNDSDAGNSGDEGPSNWYELARQERGKLEKLSFEINKKSHRHHLNKYFDVKAKSNTPNERSDTENEDGSDIDCYVIDDFCVADDDEGIIHER